MIQANELRIGNILLCGGIWVYITSINPHGVTVSKFGITNQHSEDGTGYVELLNLLDEIELTDEILLKCGFDKIGNSGLVGGITYQDANMTLLFGQGDVVYFHVDTRYMPINSLHQLQNLYFILNNKELEINE